MVKRTDFRPNDSTGNSMTEKDRQTIRSVDNKIFLTKSEYAEYEQVKSIHGKKYADKWIEAKYPKSVQEKHSKELSEEMSEHKNPDYYANNEGVRYIIQGRRWFDKVNGNTYHSVSIVDTKTNDIVYDSGMVYGYDDAYRQTAINYLIKTGRMNDDDRTNHKQNKQHLYFAVEDVARKKDL